MAVTFLLSQCRAMQTAVQGGDTVANTTTATLFASTCPVTAGDLNAVGRMLRLKAWGLYGTDAVLGKNLTVEVLAGSTVLCTTGVFTLTLAAATNDGWTLECDVACRTTGSSGTVEAQGRCAFSQTGVLTDQPFMTNTAAVTLDLTVAQTYKIRVTWGTASASDTITLRMFDAALSGTV